jgi:hypothetical protein
VISGAEAVLTKAPVHSQFPLFVTAWGSKQLRQFEDDTPEQVRQFGWHAVHVTDDEVADLL